MTCRAYLAAAFVIGGLASAGAAQEPEEIVAPTLGPSGEAYLDATQFRGLDRAVAYFDPTQPPPPFETRQTVEPEEEADLSGTTIPGGRLILTILFGTILAAILYAIYASGGRFSVSLARAPEDGVMARDAKAADGAEPPPAALSAILAMADRRAALVQLCKSLLARVMGEQGVLLDRSWTDRDTLRRVPRAHPQRDALQALVFDSEKVRFGGRDVSEEEFRAHLARLEPLWQRAGA